jgi:hypothetical protein
MAREPEKSARETSKASSSGSHKLGEEFGPGLQEVASAAR